MRHGVHAIPAIRSLVLVLLGACGGPASATSATAPTMERPSDEAARARPATPAAARPSLQCRARYSTATFELEVTSLRASTRPDEAADGVFEEFEGSYELATGTTVRRGTMTGYRNGDLAFIRGTSDDHASDEPPVELLVGTLDAAVNAVVTWTREVAEPNLFTCTGSLLTAPVDADQAAPAAPAAPRRGLPGPKIAGRRPGRGLHSTTA